MNKEQQDDPALAADIYRCCYITGNFTLRSGRQSHEYFDKYQFAADPDLLRRVAVQLARLLPSDVEVLAGLELGGIPLAVLLGQVTGLPCAFVRKEAKTYGTCRLAEGAALEGRRVVIIEDVVTSGGQVLESVKACRALGARIETVLCVVDRESGGSEALQSEGLQLKPLYTLTALKAAASAL